MSEGKRGTQRLGRALVSEMSKRSKRIPSSDLATINANLGLELDTFGIPIPAGDYLVEERFAQPNTVFTTTQVAGGGGYGSFDSHAHEITRAGTFFRPLAAGDRVIVTIIDADSDSPTFIVTGRIPNA